MATTALPSRTIRSASASPSPRGSARRAFACRISSSRAWFASDVTVTITKGRPCVVFPTSSTRHAVGGGVERLQVREDLAPVGELAVLAGHEAEDGLGRGNDRRRRGRGGEKDRGREDERRRDDQEEARSRRHDRRRAPHARSSSPAPRGARVARRPRGLMATAFSPIVAR